MQLGEDESRFLLRGGPRGRWLARTAGHDSNRWIASASKVGKWSGKSVGCERHSLRRLKLLEES